MPAALSLLLAGVFLASGAAKLRDPAGMVVLVRQVLSPRAPAPALTRGLAALELVLGLLLLTGAAPRPVAVATGVVLIAFTVLLRLAGRRAPAALASCRCFGGAADAPAGQTLARNAALLGAAIVLVVRPPASPWHLAADELAGAATVAAGLACAWLLATALRRAVVAG